MIRTLALAFAFIAVLGSIAYAQNMRRFEALNFQNPRTLAGQVNADGSIERGSNFTVSHSGAGEYGVTFSERYFVRGCPVLNITAATSAYIDVVSQSRCNLYYISFHTSNGRPADTSFNLIAVASQ